MEAAGFGVVAQGLGKGIVFEAVGESGGILQSEVDALAELRAHGVGGVAEDDGTFAMAAREADIAVAGSEDLRPVFDLGEKGFGAWGDGEDGVFPGLERLGADGFVVGNLHTPKEAD